MRRSSRIPAAMILVMGFALVCNLMSSCSSNHVPGSNEDNLVLSKVQSDAVATSAVEDGLKGGVDSSFGKYHRKLQICVCSCACGCSARQCAFCCMVKNKNKNSPIITATTTTTV
ncbi:hypothetical protein ABFX02_11G018700 [Erythranthe guttata]